MPTESFTSSTTWTCPIGIASVNAQLYGQAGNGANGDGSNGGGGGGGGASNTFTGLTVSGGTGYAINIDATSTYFINSSNSANAGANASGTTGGAGGAAPGGSPNYAGGNGGNGSSGTGGGGGGSSGGVLGAGNNGTDGDGSGGGAGGSAPVGGYAGGAGGGLSGDGVAGTSPGGGGGGGGFNSGVGAARGSGSVALTYSWPTPNFTSLDHTDGATGETKAVTITGTGFSTGCTVTFDGVPATSVVVVSDTSITCVTPIHAAGSVNVVVTNADSSGNSGASGNGAYTYHTPIVSSVSPIGGTTAGGTATTITGQYFTGATGATFGGNAGTSFSVTNDTTIAVTTPSHAGGLVNVVVANSVDNSGSSGNNAYAYTGGGATGSRKIQGA